MKRRCKAFLAALALCCAATGARGAQAAAPDETCAELRLAKLKDVEIVSASPLAQGAPVVGARDATAAGGPGSGGVISGLPAFCRVVGRIHPEPGSDIGFEVWMPRDGWDGRLTGAGNVGAAGSVFYFVLEAALRAGQASVSTDGGHRGQVDDASWAAAQPVRIRDYAWRSIHLSTVAAKALVARYYGRPADHAYFIGYSNGGRQGLVEASRFPNDYDGILAGAPAVEWTQTRMAQLWVLQAQLPPRARIRPAQAKLLQAEVLRQCDQLDGQLDGLVDDPRRCKLDVARLGCDASASPDCFTPPQLAALIRIYAGHRDPQGRWTAMPFLAAGSEVADPLFGWDRNIFVLGDTPDTAWESRPMTALDGRKIATDGAFDFDTDPRRFQAEEARGGLEDPSPDLHRFFGRGGKLILWHGWADADIPPQVSLDYRDQVLRASGARAKDSMRLFMVPGLQHGVGGKGPDLFGQLAPPPTGASADRNIAAALQAWVETGRKPESVIGRRHSAGATEAGAPPAHSPRERLICAYPARAVLAQGADPERAQSYACVN